MVPGIVYGIGFLCLVGAAFIWAVFYVATHRPPDDWLVDKYADHREQTSKLGC